MSLRDFLDDYASVPPSDIRSLLSALTEALKAYTEKTEEETRVSRRRVPTIPEPSSR